MSDRGLPRSFRFMEGFGVHTFRFVNQAGRATFVKFHWKPKLGLQSVLPSEAAKINGADPDFHRRDLWDSIEAGDFPEWDLGLQLFGADTAALLPFDVLDPTKLIPEEQVPIRRVGRLVLDRNVKNAFAETEQWRSGRRTSCRASSSAMTCFAGAQLLVSGCAGEELGSPTTRSCRSTRRSVRSGTSSKTAAWRCSIRAAANYAPNSGAVGRVPPRRRAAASRRMPKKSWR
jgi:hypothetical protein